MDFNRAQLVMRQSQRRLRYTILALGVVGGCAAMWFFRPAHRYNVLLVTLDTTRADHIGCYGDTNAYTPTLDALAQDGVVFEHAYATVPLTLPSHTSILTGLYPPENGMHLNGRGRLDEQLPNLADTLRREGYNTAAFIASVVLHAKYGLDHGFQFYDDDMAGGERHGHESHLMRNADQVVDSALSWLDGQTDDPFFCWVHLFDPHAPYDSHAEVFQNRFDDRPYDGDIAFADLHVGRLVEFLKSRSLYERTLIVVVGDHGEGLGEHLEDEHGFMLHNSTLRVPLIISGPDFCRAGHRVVTAVSQVDLFPTVLDCLHIDLPGRVSGVSLRDGLRGKPVRSHLCYAETEAVSDAFGWAPLSGVADESWKYVHTTRDELFNLQEDPDEVHNLSKARPKKLEEMRQQLESLRQQMDQHAAADVDLTDADRRKLESLGYLAGGSTPSIRHDENHPTLPDVKDMIVHYKTEVDARKMIREGRINEAIERLQDTIEAAPEFIPARMTLGAALQKQGRPEEAVEVFQAAIDIDPEADAPHFELGKHFAAVGETAKAIEHYSAALERDPRDATTHFNLGSLLFAEGDFEAARTHYEVGLKEFPDSVVGQFNFSVLLFSRGDIDAALRHARRAAQLSPENPQIQFHLGRTYASAGDFHEAVICFQRTLRLAPSYPQAEEHLQQAQRAARR